jgi:hypothetical protein
MRARRFRPTFDTLTQRITPSGVTPIAAPLDTATSNGMPGSTTTIDPGTWTQPTNVLNPTLDPTTWLAANPN